MPHQSKVLSSIDSGNYTYIEVSEGGKIVWLVTPTMSVKKGYTVGYGDGTVMSNFFVKGLNLTLETLRYVEKVVVIK